MRAEGGRERQRTVTRKRVLMHGQGGQGNEARRWGPPKEPRKMAPNQELAWSAPGDGLDETHWRLPRRSSGGEEREAVRVDCGLYGDWRERGGDPGLRGNGASGLARNHSGRRHGPWGPDGREGKGREAPHLALAPTLNREEEEEPRWQDRRRN